MSRTKAERRFLNITHALRKRQLSRNFLHDYDYYDNLHQFSKNKIHCSCPYCSIKTNNNFYGSDKNYKKSDLVQLQRLNYEKVLWLEN